MVPYCFLYPKIEYLCLCQTDLNILHSDILIKQMLCSWVGRNQPLENKQLDYRMPAAKTEQLISLILHFRTYVHTKSGSQIPTKRLGMRLSGIN